METRAGRGHRLVPWRGQTRTFGRRPRGDPGLVALRPAASGTGTVTFVASRVLARRRGQRNPGSSGGRAEQRLGFRQSPHAGPVPASVPTSSWGPPEGGAPVASSRGWGSGPRPRGQCGAAGCGLRAASGGGRCLGTHSDLRPVSVCEWCPRPVSPVAGPQPSAELAAGPRSGAARRGPEPRTPAPAVSGTGSAVRARGPGSWAALGMAGGEGSPAPDEPFRAPVSSPRHSEPGTAPQACSPLQGALSVGVGQAHSQLTPGPLQAPQSPRGGLSLGVAGLLVTSYRPLWDRVCCWAGHSEVTIRVWVCLPAGPPGTLPGSPHPPPPARDMQLDPPCW